MSDKQIIQNMLIGAAAYKAGDIIGGSLKIHRLLGMGGFGVVYLASSVIDERIMALKTFRDEFIFDSRIKDQFRKEALLWVGLGEHPSILSARRVQEIDGRMFVAMDYIAPNEDGLVTMHDHIGHHGAAITPRQVSLWALQFCNGMEYANSKGIIAHRDIKPLNILIDRDVFVRIADFGIAAAIQHVPPRTLMRSISQSALVVNDEGKTSCGTPGYLAPEIYRGEAASVRSDIYSFGVVLWQLSAGTTALPFAAKFNGDVGQYMNDIYKCQITGRMRAPGGPFQSVIAQCVQPDPQQRYRTFAQVREAIKDAYKRSGGVNIDLIFSPPSQVASLVSRASNLRVLGAFDRALRCYDEALELEPANAIIWSNKANVLCQLERYTEAHAAYDEALRLDPTFAAAWLNKGIALKDQRDLSNAIVCIDKALAIKARNALAWQKKGESFALARQHGEALKCYDTSLELSDKNEKAWCKRAEALLAMARGREASESYEKAIAVNALCSEAWRGNAQVLCMYGLYEKALHCADVALALNSEDISALVTKANALCRTGRQEDGLIIYDRVLERGAPGEETVIWTNKGNALLELGRPQEALICLDAAVKYDPNYVHAWCQRGKSMEVLGNFDEAVDCYDKAIKIEPANLHYWAYKGTACLRSGRIDEAVYCYDNVLAVNPDNAKLLYNKGIALGSNERRLADALVCFRDAVKHDPNYAQSWYAKAYLESRLGKRLDAIASCQAFLRLSGEAQTNERKNVSAWLTELQHRA